jgi:hypothetical protein
MRALVGAILTHAIEQLDLHLPEVSDAELTALDSARQERLAD